MTLMGLPDIHVMNAVKTLYIMTINIVASIVFIAPRGGTRPTYGTYFAQSPLLKHEE